ESSGLLGTVSGRAVALAQRGRIGTCSCSSLLVAGRINPTEVPRMTPDATRLLAEALHLPESERSELAARLIESLDPSGQEDATAAWSAEIQTRLEELQKGQVQPIRWPESRREILEDAEESRATCGSSPGHCRGPRCGAVVRSAQRCRGGWPDARA